MASPEVAAPNLWQRFLAQGPLQVFLWIAIVVSWVYLMVLTDWKLHHPTVWAVPFLLMAAALSTPWRSVRWKTVLTFFMLGMGPAFLLIILTGWVFETTGFDHLVGGWLEGTSIGYKPPFIGRDIFSPFVEEFFKVFPLLLVFWWTGSGVRTSAGPIDYAVLAGATGTGMGFSENIMIEILKGTEGSTSQVFALWMGPPYTRLMGVDRTSFIFSGRTEFGDKVAFLLPEMRSHAGYIWSGHGAYALGIGLSLGLAVWWWRQRRSKWIFAIPVVMYLWAVLEHSMFNWQGGAACGFNDWLMCHALTINLHGRAFPIVVLIGWGYAMWVSGKHLREHRRQDPALALSKSVDRSTYTSRGWRGWLEMVSDRFAFHRFRRKTGYGAFHLKRPTITPLQELTLKANRIETLILKEKLEGRPPTDVPEGVRHLIDNVASLP